MTNRKQITVKNMYAKLEVHPCVSIYDQGIGFCVYDEYGEDNTVIVRREKAIAIRDLINQMLEEGLFDGEEARGEEYTEDDEEEEE